MPVDGMTATAAFDTSRTRTATTWSCTAISRTVTKTTFGTDRQLSRDEDFLWNGALNPCRPGPDCPREWALARWGRVDQDEPVSAAAGRNRSEFDTLTKAAYRQLVPSRKVENSCRQSKSKCLLFLPIRQRSFFQAAHQAMARAKRMQPRMRADSTGTPSHSCMRRRRSVRGDAGVMWARTRWVG
jgi:hypothetical protein